MLIYTFSQMPALQANLFREEAEDIGALLKPLIWYVNLFSVNK